MIVVKGLTKAHVEYINAIIGIGEYMDDGRKREQIKKWQRSKGLLDDGIIGQKTLDAIGIDLTMERINVNSKNAKFNMDIVRTAVLGLKYKWFSGGNYNLNIVGIRNSNTGNRVTNLFDDWITASYSVNGTWVYKEWAATTDPGTKSVTNFSNVRGVARLVPNQYIDCYALGKHQGKYDALRQVGVVSVYRDADRNTQFSTNKTQSGLFGINIHKAGIDSNVVENWSAGCQVFKREADFNEFMTIVNKSISVGYNKFTYTLIDSKNFFEKK